MSERGDSSGGLAAGERLRSVMTPGVYDQLRGLASAYVSRSRGEGALLQPTALLHEAFLKLAQCDGLAIRSEEHFRAIAAAVMRQVLIDHVRGERALKRGGDRRRVSLADHHAVTRHGSVDMLVLDDLLVRLEELDPRAARVAEMRLFGSAPDELVAEVLGVSERTVRNDWAMARAWLRRRLERGGEDG